MSNATRVEILDALLASDEPRTAVELRSVLRIPSKDRATFGRHLQRLSDLGLIEQVARGDAFAIVEPGLTEAFLQRAADLEAALDAARAARSDARARARRKTSLTRTTQRAARAETRR